ncbi:MAG: adenosylcobinamide-GDP ribazoletransferase [Pseudomonadota bacterium]
MTQTNSSAPVDLHDIPAAFSLLTRLPVPVDHTRAGARGAASAWAWPLVGAALGLLAGGAAWILLTLGAPAGVAAAAALAVMAVGTGGLHEDGLSDCADGLGGGFSKERALEIMKDSRVGAFGAVALGVALLARWSAIAEASEAEIVAVCVIAGMLSRAVMILPMLAMPPARLTGMSAGVGRPRAVHAVIAFGLAAVGLTLCFPALELRAGVAIVAASLLTPLPLLWLAQRRIGGQTGDVLGGTQQLAEIGALTALVSLLP